MPQALSMGHILILSFFMRAYVLRLHPVVFPLAFVPKHLAARLVSQKHILAGRANVFIHQCLLPLLTQTELNF